MAISIKPNLGYFCAGNCLKTVARDLWAMYVTLTNLEAEPFKEGDEETDEPSSPEKASHIDPLQKIYEALSESEDDAMPSSSRGFGYTDTDIEDTEEKGPPENANQQDLHGNGARSRMRNRSVRNHQRFNPAGRFRLQYTLVICYLSCLTMRVPILMKDILEYASSFRTSPSRAERCFLVT